MKKLGLLTGITFLIIAFSFVWVRTVNAHSFRTGPNVTVGQNQRVEDSLFAAGNTIDINGEVFGDIFCAGQTVAISGTVHGDVICAGQSVRVSGTVDGDVRLAGQTVTVSAAVAGNATVAGETFNLESTGKIGGDVTVGSSDAVFNGLVGRDIAADTNNLTVASTVGRNIKGNVGSLHLNSGAQVNGGITYTSSKDLSKDGGAVVSGRVDRTEPTHVDNKSKRGAVFGFGIAWFMYWLLAMLFIAMALALLFPRMLQAVTDNALPRPWKALLTGFVASLAVPVILLVLAITVIGLPAAFIFGLVWLLVVLLSGPLAGFYVGRLVLRESRQPLLIMLVGAAILAVAYFIPIIGMIVLFAAMWIGQGMLLLEIFKRTPKPAYTFAENN